MKSYKVIVADSAKQRLREFLNYLKYDLGSQQAAKSVYSDYVATRKKLEDIAGSLKLCDDLDLSSLGYHRINFRHHSYFLLYRVEGNYAYVDYIFHDLEDYKNKMH